MIFTSAQKMALLTALAITSCSSGQLPSLRLTAAEKSGIQTANMDLSVRPQDDFFTYVNGNWVKNTAIPADKASWGAFNELRDLTDKNSLTLLDELIKSNPREGSEAQKIKTAYAAYLNFNARNQRGLSPLNPVITAVNQAATWEELQKIIISMAKEGGSNPFYDWYVYADMKDSRTNAVYLTGGKILLPRDYYQKKTAKNKEVIAAYRQFVAGILTRLNISRPQETAAAIVALEQSIAAHLLTNEKIRDARLQYNPRTVTQLSQISTAVNLPQFLTETGVNTAGVIIDEIDYFNHLDTLLKKQKLAVLQAYYLYWLTVQNHANLDRDLETAYFAFFKKYLQGQKEKRSDVKTGLDFINGYLDEAFGKVYVAKYFPGSAKAQMVELVAYLNKSYQSHLENLTWMSPPTKEKALYKLSKLNVKVGYPDKWEDYSQLRIKPQEDNIYTIRQAVLAWKNRRELAKIGKKVDKSRWEMSPQTVNAYYNPMYHEIVFPAAILQPPFFDPKASAAVNFGGIGGVIGHEITHGFDDSGSMFDADGNLNNWWSKKDKTEFDRLTGRLATQFNHYEVIPGEFVNGQFTLGENIADLGGVNIAYDALQLYLRDKKLLPKEAAAPVLSPAVTDAKPQFTVDQEFFISWASVWRSKATGQYLQNQVKVDPHAPERIRAFAPLTNTDAFYQTFGLQPADKLYRAPKDRVVIW